MTVLRITCGYKDNKRRQYLSGNDQEKKDPQKVLHLRLDENISGLLSCGGFFKSLYPDLLIQDLASYRCVKLGETLLRQGRASVD